MGERYRVVESRVTEDATTTHLVSAPGGTIEVMEDGSGDLRARLPAGYVLGGEAESDVLLEAERAVRTLSQPEGGTGVAGAK